MCASARCRPDKELWSISSIALATPLRRRGVARAIEEIDLKWTCLPLSATPPAIVTWVTASFLVKLTVAPARADDICHTSDSCLQDVTRRGEGRGLSELEKFEISRKQTFQEMYQDTGSIMLESLLFFSKCSKPLIHFFAQFFYLTFCMYICRHKCSVFAYAYILSISLFRLLSFWYL